MAQRNYYRYTADDGATHYAVKEISYLASITSLAWGAASAADPAPPLGFRPRVVYVRDPTSGRTRQCKVATAAAYAALLAGGQTIALPDMGSGTAVTFNVTNGRGEGFNRGTRPHLIH
jgi:hypothetical protein